MQEGVTVVNGNTLGNRRNGSDLASNFKSDQETEFCKGNISSVETFLQSRKTVR